MKFIAILSVLLLIVSLVGVGSLYMTANVVVEAAGVSELAASTQPELFAELRDQVRLGAVVGTQFVNATELGSAGDYQFLTYTVRLRNDCYVSADMVELQVTPMTGDVLQLGTSADVKLPSKATTDISASILTKADMHPIREVTVTYYVWGVPFTLKTTVQ